MDRPARIAVLRVIDAAWRRRYLLLVPIFLMLPLSVLAAIILPGTYVTRCLMLLQDASWNNALSKTSSYAPQTGSERVASLRALLASDYVLGQTLDELGLGSSDAKQRALDIQQLRSRVSLDLIGEQLLEFGLSGTVPEGMGKQLDAVASNFMEAISAQGGTTVGDLLLVKKRKELEAAEQEYDRLRELLRRILPSNLDDSVKQLEAMKRRLREIAQRDASNSTALEELRTQIGTQDQSNKKSQEDLIGLLLQIQELDAAKFDLKQEAEQLEATIRHVESSINEYHTIKHQLAASEQALSVARETYDAYKKRFSNVGIGRSVPLINTPERTIVIDPAKDPEFRTSRRIYIFLFGAIAGVLLGIVLATVAEIMDGTIRYADRAVFATGVPVLARLPKITLEGGHAPIGLKRSDILGGYKGELPPLNLDVVPHPSNVRANTSGTVAMGQRLP